MADEIQEVKERIDIVQAISEYVSLKRSGRNFTALCPFHKETSPSFYVSPERQIWHCFGCDRGGDVFAFLMEKEGLSFGEALRILAQKAGVELSRGYSAGQQEKRERLLRINLLASEFYHHLLVRHKVGQRARVYLENRGISQTSVKDFNLGYAPKSWEATGKFLLSKKFSLEELYASGLIIRREKVQHGRSEWYDRFRGRIMFPIYDFLGRTLGFTARTLEQEEPKYLNSPDSLVFSKGKLLYGLNLAKDAIREKDYLVLVEGSMDVISLHQRGIMNCSAPLGTGFTPEHAKLIKRFTSNVMLVFDNDEAGRQATFRAIEILVASALQVKVASIKEAQDPDELARKNPALLKDILRNAQPYLEYLFSEGRRQFNLSSERGKQRLAQFVLPVVDVVQDAIVREAHVKRIAEELQVSERSVWEELEKIRSVEVEEKEKSELITFPRKSRQERVEERFLSLILNAIPSWLSLPRVKKVLRSIRKDYFVNEQLAEIWQVLCQVWRKKHNLDIKTLAAEFKSPLVQRFDLLLLAPGVKIENKDEFTQELDLLKRQLTEFYYKGKLRDYTFKLKQAEKSGDEKEKERLKRKIQEISQKL